MHDLGLVDRSLPTVPHIPGVRLGGLDFGVFSPSADLVTDDSDAHAPFSVPVSPAAADVIVRLACDDPPDTSGMSTLFVGGPLYTVYAEGADRVVVLQPPASARPTWIARFSLEMARVTVWFDPDSAVSVDGSPSVAHPLRYPLDQILLMYALARREGVLLHAAGAIVGGRTLVCCGRSGAGKSTLTRQFLAAGFTDLLSDDRIVVRRAGTGFRTYGTPWSGEAGIAGAGIAPAGALLFLNHGTENKVCELSRGQALHRLLPVASIPWYDREVLGEVLSFCQTVVETLPAFEFEFRPEPDAAVAIGRLVAQGAIW